MKRFEPAEIEELIQIATAHGLTFVAVEEPDREIEVALARTPRQPATRSDTTRAVVEPAADEFAYVRSGLVGYFRASEETLKNGAEVDEGTLVGVVEALGLPNDVISNHKGVVAEVLVEDRQPVEYGQPIARISKR